MRPPDPPARGAWRARWEVCGQSARTAQPQGEQLSVAFTADPLFLERLWVAGEKLPKKQVERHVLGAVVAGLCA